MAIGSIAGTKVGRRAITPKQHDTGKVGDIAVAVQCHSAYLPVLGRCIAAIDAQTVQPCERFLVLDGCDVSPDLFPGWNIIKRDDGTPNPGRNAALCATKADWIWFMDADDVPLRGYLAGASPLTARPDVGIIHANLKYSDGRTRHTPDMDYWELRMQNYVSTESVWRVRALIESGGWQRTHRFDDWTCALNVTRLGWKTARQSVPIAVTVYPASNRNHRNRNTLDFQHKWLRSYGVVSLLAGREDCWDDWADMMLATELPPNTHVYLVDNSQSARFGEKVRKFIHSMTAEWCVGVTYSVQDTSFVDVDKWSRHRHVASLYNHILPRVTEDVLFLWEDDVIPPSDESFMKMVDQWNHIKDGGICALYPTRKLKGRACGARSHDFWRDIPKMEEVRGNVVPNMGFLPGGFAIYNNALVRNALPFYVSFPNGHATGWDGMLSQTVRDNGYGLVLDGTIECEHRLPGGA